MGRFAAIAHTRWAYQIELCCVAWKSFAVWCCVEELCCVALHTLGYQIELWVYIPCYTTQLDPDGNMAKTADEEEDMDDNALRGNVPRCTPKNQPRGKQLQE